VAKASGYAGADDGVFSAAQFLRAVKDMSQKGPSGVRTGVATGRDFLMPEAEAANKLLKDTVGNSYTFDRWALATALTGGGFGALNEWYGGPGFITAAALAPAIMSPAGRKYMVSGYGWQPTLGQGLRQMAPYASQAARAASEKK
jgi:hypothetical protein